MKTVTFCGHREIPFDDINRITPIIYDEIEKLIKNGADTFLLGGYGTFDHLCAIAVKKLKEKYPYIKSTLVLAYLNKSYDKELYDCTEYPPIEKAPKRFAIAARNKYMVEKADAIVSYVIFTWGGAYETLEHAKRKKKTIINIS